MYSFTCQTYYSKLLAQEGDADPIVYDMDFAQLNLYIIVHVQHPMRIEHPPMQIFVNVANTSVIYDVHMCAVYLLHTHCVCIHVLYILVHSSSAWETVQYITLMLSILLY